ncbi:TIM barrel protein [Microlunatus parietis]|uniref:Sugar phosphate isomerase/epimerase n=1 Tax=Microlunatus parietis TaxID=682979 RepID=A0A7Y9LAD3_9ACTN|nr:TIM barrel protein [Microlunatus parietis]NYE72719.1 sugar phosphate isomerase/epimerase [Microlunatus parietis]
MIIAVTCSTGAFSRDPDVVDAAGIVAAARRVDADGFELLSYPAFADDPKDSTSIFSRSGLPWTSVHAGKAIGPLLSSGTADDRRRALALLDADLRLATALGVEIAVLHLWGMPDSDRRFPSNLAAVSDCLDHAERFGVTLGIETIPCLEATPLARLSELQRRDPRCRWTLDTEFLALHDELDLALADADLFAGTKIIHVKDYDGEFVDRQGRRRYLHPGQGRLDLAAVAEAAASSSSSIRLCLESSSVRPDGSIDLGQVNADLDTLRGFVPLTSTAGVSASRRPGP